jgi:hypothetical protein
MTVSEIKNKLKQKATVFKTGGKKPTGALLESWIGSVRWSLESELSQQDKSGKEMIPLATIFLKGLPYIPAELNGVELLTIFMSPNVYDNLIDEDLSPFFVIRKYTTLDGLVERTWNADIIKSFPLFPQLVDNDFPTWDNGGIPLDLEDEILALENDEGIDYFDDICEEMYGVHKVGGYPCFCQSGYWFGNGYKFVMQISSDEKAKFNIVDCGNFYFFYHPEKEDWKVYCDFY